jgi:hypothetical protein
VKIAISAVVIGTGATAIMDLWLALLRRWRIPSLDLHLLGRWIGHFPRGRFAHENISSAVPIRHERMIGWSAHYGIGIFFATVLLAIWGPGWLQNPTLGPALIVSSATLVAPFLIMQPAMGAGVAASMTPRPHVARLRSLATHTVYGMGVIRVGPALDAHKRVAVINPLSQKSKPTLASVSI